MGASGATGEQAGVGDVPVTPSDYRSTTWGEGSDFSVSAKKGARGGNVAREERRLDRTYRFWPAAAKAMRAATRRAGLGR